jgi:histone deacetylase HOS3
MPLESPAVLFVHDRPLIGSDGTQIEPYPHQLKEIIAAVKSKHEVKESEMPSQLSQRDLYLHSQSIDAIEGALGALCEAVDSVSSTPGLQTRFVSIRPPGHHCNSNRPSGFCFINNVAVAAAHAYLEHDYDRVVVSDLLGSFLCSSQIDFRY